MARRPNTEDVLRSLNAVAASPTTEESRRALVRAFEHQSPHVIAKAAGIVEEAGLEGFDNVMEARLQALLDADAPADPGCPAKTALACALRRTGARAADVLLRGIRHRQVEPSFGKPVDTAGRLRAACALALAAGGHPDTPALFADLLADPEPVARSGAARALGMIRGDVSAPLLRYAVRRGDEDPQVTADALSSLLAIDAEGSLDLALAELQAPDPGRQQAAALAVGEARCTAGQEALQELAEKTRDPRTRRVAYLALGMLRCDPAREFLLAQLRSAPAPVAALAIDALAIDRATRADAERAAGERRAGGDGDLREMVRKAFG